MLDAARGAGVGYLLGSGALDSTRRPLSPELIAQADPMLARVGATRKDFDVRAQDDVLLRGWKVRPVGANGDCVPGAAHASALGAAPAEFERRVVAFYGAIHAARK